VVLRVADGGDIAALAALRSPWNNGVDSQPGFERRMAAWLAAEGSRRTTWLASLGELPVAMLLDQSGTLLGGVRVLQAVASRSVEASCKAT
jgi:hypothetical protein